MQEDDMLKRIYEELGGLKQQIADVADEGKQERGKIIQQTTRTNGRVSKLEQWINDYQVRKDERNRINGTDNNDIHGNRNVNIRARSQWFEDEFIRKFIIALTAVATALAVYLGVR